MAVVEKQKVFKFVDWFKVKRHCQLVISSGAEPNETYDHALIPGLSIDTFLTRVPRRDLVRPSRIWEACRDRKWFAELDCRTDGRYVIKVGDLTYDIPASKFCQ